MSRRRFLFRCLGIPALGAAAKSPQLSIPSDVKNFSHREEEDVADAIRPQVSNSSSFPRPEFGIGEEVESCGNKKVVVNSQQPLEENQENKHFENYAATKTLYTIASTLQWHPERVDHHMAETYLIGFPRLKKSGFSYRAIAQSDATANSH